MDDSYDKVYSIMEDISTYINNEVKTNISDSKYNSLLNKMENLYTSFNDIYNNYDRHYDYYQYPIYEYIAGNICYDSYSHYFIVNEDWEFTTPEERNVVDLINKYWVEDDTYYIKKEEDTIDIDDEIANFLFSELEYDL